MKKFVKIFAAMLVLAGMLALGGCSSRDSDLVGTWVSNDNPSFITTFNEDGTGTHAISWGYGTTFNWSTSGSNLVWNYSGHPRMRTGYSISGNVLTFELDGGITMRYTRNP